MSKDSLITYGYLDVKISAKVKRGFTPWKAWKKQWCEIKRLNNVDSGIEIKLKNTPESHSLNCFTIPREAMLCRTESRSKKFSFGIFVCKPCHKPLVFLSGSSETETQLWMKSFRRMLCISSYLPVSESSFYVSLIDNSHSRAAGLTGLHGILATNIYEVMMKEPQNGVTQIRFPWTEFLQFHLAVPVVPEDNRNIVVVHTSKEFRSGAGQLHLFCTEAPKLLECLMARGKLHPFASPPKICVHPLKDKKRLSMSEGDLRDIETVGAASAPSAYYRFRSELENSGHELSTYADDSTFLLKCKKAVSFVSLGLSLLAVTPGGSEIDNESSHELLLENEEEQLFTDFKRRDPEDLRRESGISSASGVYEEITDAKCAAVTVRHSLHTYEDPVDIILSSSKLLLPPPLPPRREQTLNYNEHLHVEYSLRFVDSESEYMLMNTPAPECTQTTDHMYLPMHTKTQENDYMLMRGKNNH